MNVVLESTSSSETKKQVRERLAFGRKLSLRLVLVSTGVGAAASGRRAGGEGAVYRFTRQVPPVPPAGPGERKGGLLPVVQRLYHTLWAYRVKFGE